MNIYQKENPVFMKDFVIGGIILSGEFRFNNGSMRTIKKQKIMNKEYNRTSVLKMLKTRRNKAIAEIKSKFINESLIDSDEKDFNYMMQTANISGVQRLQRDIEQLEFLINCLKQKYLKIV